MENEDTLKAVKRALQAIMRERGRWCVLVGTGTSVAVNQALGMPALAKHLFTRIPEETEGWAPVRDALQAGKSLEDALTGPRMSTSLGDAIAEHVAGFVAKEDAQVRNNILVAEKSWPAAKLLKKLVDACSTLPVITPNYDMLIEYSCSANRIAYTSGYCGGVLGRLDWERSRQTFKSVQSVSNGRKQQKYPQTIPHVELMKVHGSINLFRDSKGAFFQCDQWIGNPPDGYVPVIAPPGDLKAQETLNHYRKLFSEAGEAINRATAFLVIGYGFNDPHIHDEILSRVRSDNCPLIVLTRDPSGKLDSLANEGDDVWVLTRADNGEPSTRVLNSKMGGIGEFGGIALWESNSFAEQILGI